MSRIITVANQKGGVGKTTTVVNTAAGLAMAGRKVLVIDLDPQANTVSGFGIPKERLENTVYDLLLDDRAKAGEHIRSTAIAGLDCIPSSIDLAGAQVELGARQDRYHILKRKLAPVKGDYDIIFIDTPPSLGFLTLSSLAAADRVLIPLQAEYYALEGLSQLLKTIQIVQKKLNSGLEIMGIVVTMFDARTNLSGQVLEEVNRFFKGRVFKTVIPRNVKLSEAPSFGKPVLLYQPSSVGADSYRALAKELWKHG